MASQTSNGLVLLRTSINPNVHSTNESNPVIPLNYSYISLLKRMYYWYTHLEIDKELSTVGRSLLFFSSKAKLDRTPEHLFGATETSPRHQQIKLPAHSRTKKANSHCKKIKAIKITKSFISNKIYLSEKNVVRNYINQLLLLLQQQCKFTLTTYTKAMHINCLLKCLHYLPLAIEYAISIQHFFYDTKI